MTTRQAVTKILRGQELCEMCQAPLHGAPNKSGDTVHYVGAVNLRTHKECSHIAEFCLRQLFVEVDDLTGGQ